MPPETDIRRQRPSRRAIVATVALGALLAACAGPSQAGGRIVDVDIVDRDNGRVLDVYHHRGRHYVAGRPGARYAIRVRNRSGARVLAVVSVDGVNIVSGQSADWRQTGYVFEPWQSYELTGWRKSDQQVAAFEFTALPDAYATRTGRPHDVGVIGVAVFRERPRPVAQAPQPVPHAHKPGRQERERLGSAAAESRADAQDRLGTGHGGREPSHVTRTDFERASPTPAQIVSIHYDRHENLLAAGIVPRRWFDTPRPFPGAPDDPGYVPDPTGR